MVQIATIDLDAQEIFLHIDTVTNGLDPIIAHFELNALVAANFAGAQNYGIISDAQGNLPKGGGRFTARRLRLSPGWRFIPYATGTRYRLNILAEIINPDEALADRELFNRDHATLNATQVDIDAIYTDVEIREVTIGGSALTEVGIAGAVWDHVISGFKARTWLHWIWSFAGGLASGANAARTPGTMVFKAVDGVTTVASVDNDGIGNRTAQVLTDPES
jgi:hypothetical protein